MLFRHLPPDLFRPLTYSYGAAYEAVLRRLHDGAYSSDYCEAITRQDLLKELGQALHDHKATLGDPERAAFKLADETVYLELRESGWLVEQRDGWKTLVEMDRMAFRLLHFLCTMEEADTHSFSENLVSVCNNFDGALKDPELRATGLLAAAREAREFAAYARSIVGTLKTIEQQMMEAGSLNGFVSIYFDDFVKQVLVRDYRNLTAASNHPNSLRLKVAEMADEIGDNTPILGRICDSLIAAGHAVDRAKAENLVAASVRQTMDALEAIEGFRRRIDRSRLEVERRFEMAIRYMSVFKREGGPDYTQALRDLGAAFPAGEGDPEILVDTGLREPLTHYDAARARDPVLPRAPVVPTMNLQDEPDPIALAFEHAKAEFQDMLSITPAQFVDYVGRQIELHGPVVEAARIPPTDLQEVIIFSLLRALPMDRISLPGGVELVRREGIVKNKWLTCGDFALVSVKKRKGAASAR